MDLSKIRSGLSTGMSLNESDNPALWTYKRVEKIIQNFEEKLNQDQEIGLRLVSFNDITIYLDSIGYWGPNIIIFYGASDKGEKVELIQNISQLNILLITLPKTKPESRSIGFIGEINK